VCARFKSTFDLQHLDAKSELHFTCSMCALFCFGLQFLLRSFMGSCTCLESLLIDFAFGRRFDGKLHHSVHALNDICRQLNNKLPERSITCLSICLPLYKQQLCSNRSIACMYMLASAQMSIVRDPAALALGKGATCRECSGSGQIDCARCTHAPSGTAFIQL
jgi:hypothetical protein